ncbi:MAG: chemotaxis protein CheC [Roseiflexaceae bacterium]
MILNEQQQDALSELINIAFSRTAASLSDLTGQRVLLEAPQVEVLPLAELGLVLDSQMQAGDIASVHQMFSGQLSGDAFLILGYTEAVRLTSLLTEPALQSSRLDSSAREVLTEVGNILLNACLSVFGNLLQMHITFAVPQLRLDELQALLGSVVFDSDDVQYALIVFASFVLRDSAVNGYLVVVLGVTSLDSLIQAIERLG